MSNTKQNTRNYSLLRSWVGVYMCRWGLAWERENYKAKTLAYYVALALIRANQTITLEKPVEQTRIVAILYKFDVLTNSTSEGLPREIELRQKQYEYYCNLLLGFPKPDTEVAA